MVENGIHLKLVAFNGGNSLFYFSSLIVHLDPYLTLPLRPASLTGRTSSLSGLGKQIAN